MHKHKAFIKSTQAHVVDTNTSHAAGALAHNGMQNSQVDQEEQGVVLQCCSMQLNAKESDW
jgi:hypothetical protein